MSASHAIISTAAAAAGESDSTSSSCPSLSPSRCYHNSCCSFTLVYCHSYSSAADDDVVVIVDEMDIIFGICPFVIRNFFLLS